MSRPPLETWEIDLLNKHLRDCAVPVIHEPDGSVSVGTGEVAAEKLRAMERRARSRLPPIPSFPSGFFGPGFTTTKPEPVRIPMRPGFRADPAPEPPTFASVTDTVAQIRTGRPLRAVTVTADFERALLADQAEQRLDIDQKRDAEGSGAYCGIPVVSAPPGQAAAMEELGILAILGPPLDGTHPMEEYGVIKKGEPSA